MPLYTTLANVQARLVGKVSFTTDPTISNKMQESLANSLIDEAEGQVEYDMSPRYAAPFVGLGGGDFTGVPDRPTGQIIRTMCELQAVCRILETDFGSGSAANGDKYSATLMKRYNTIKDQQLERIKDGLGWRYPPLPGLALNYMNTEADDGYQGGVLIASGSASQGYPRQQINNPAENFFNGCGDDLDTYFRGGQ